VSSIAESIQILAGTYGKFSIQVMVCEVTDVSASERTCTVQPLSDNLQPFPAQLMADIDDGVLILPTKGSTVKIMLSELITPTVIQFSQVDEILLVGGGSAVKVYDSGVELQGDEYGGLMKVTPSVKAWNDLQNDVNTLKVQLLALTTAIGASGGGTVPLIGSVLAGLFTTNLGSYCASVLPLTIETQIENPKVKHGGGI
jgi:hypothetical protein